MSKLYAAFGEIELPCPIGTPISGWIPPERPMRMKLDPLQANMAILKNGEATLVLVSMDLLMLDIADADEMRRLVAETVGSTYENVLIAVTHSHCGPAATECYDSPKDHEFVSTVKKLLVQCARETYARLEPAVLGSSFTYENDISWNRRYVLPNGHAWAHPQLDKMEVLYAEGPNDPQVGVICVRNMEGNAMGYVVNFACHPLFYGGQRIATANFPGVLRRELKKKENPNCVTVFIQGAAGDISHNNPFDRNRTTMESVGTRLAERSYEAALAAQYTDEVILKGKVADAQLPKRVLTEEQIARAKQVLAGEDVVIEPSWHPVSSMDKKVFAEKLLELREDCEREPLLRAPLQVLQIGETAWAAVPAELFVKLGMEVKLGSKMAKTYVAAYSNGMVGYVCTPEAYEHGGYEATPCGGSRVDPGAGAVIVKGLLELLSEL